MHLIWTWGDLWSLRPFSVCFSFFQQFPILGAFLKHQQVCGDPNLCQQQLAFSSCGRRWIADKHFDIFYLLWHCTRKAALLHHERPSRVQENCRKKTIISPEQQTFNILRIPPCLPRFVSEKYLNLNDPWGRWLQKFTDETDTDQAERIWKIGGKTFSFQFSLNFCQSEFLAARKIHHLDMAPGSTRRLRRETSRLQPVEFLRSLEMDLLCAKWWLNLKMIPFLGWKFVRT